MGYNYHNDNDDTHEIVIPKVLADTYTKISKIFLSSRASCLTYYVSHLFFSSSPTGGNMNKKKNGQK